MSSNLDSPQQETPAAVRDEILPTFPPDFIFGAATSAYQIEGCTDRECYGRGPSIWDTYFQNRPWMDHGAIAADHYSWMAEDVALMADLKLDSYRFSVAWPRILPEGRGVINRKGLDFYERLIDELLRNGIVPNLTLYHWDLPQAMQDIGGWCERDVALYFADYAAIIARALGDRVPMWATLNEPEVIVSGYIGRDLAPGFGDRSLRMRVIHTLLLAHGFGVQALRSVLPSTQQVGMVVNLVPIDPLTESAAGAAESRWMRDYAIYLEAMFRGAYPVEVADEIARHDVEILAGDMALIAAAIDFLGVNWYLRLVVDEHDRLVEVPNVARTLMGWEIRAEALTRTLTRIAQDYRLPPIYITENGAALADAMENGTIEDGGRIAYLADHLAAIASAIEAGVSVKGYYVWSLFDNLEWSLGFKKTFGIVHVDRETLVRTPKESAKWYRRVIEQHRLQAPLRA
ncbi:MAG: beta-glucosidase [Bdellovibrionales bacterium]|nr:beta-glucosidase [Bdellovibrionales bacterium]